MTPKTGPPSPEAAPPAEPGPSDQSVLLENYRRIRRQTEAICAPLETEDYVIQTMTDVSPAKWHLAHTSWFFETFVLEPSFPGYTPFHPDYRHLFNSYYFTVGPMHFRPERGLLSRPTVKEIYAYRAHVDRHMEAFLTEADEQRLETAGPLVILGLNHCQQHQELLLTDLKHVFSRNPLFPAYRSLEPEPKAPVSAQEWLEFEEGVRYLGQGDRGGFCFDNETPQHRVFVEPFRLGSRLVTNGEYMEFMAAGGYGEPRLWLSDGWYGLEEKGWEAPLYWIRQDGGWWQFTLGGLCPVRESEPVCHLSYYEADAYARWTGARLPTEAEWETAAGTVPVSGNLLETDALHPRAAAEQGTGPRQMYGDVWEWTGSAYSPYPGYRPPAGALGEYNGKFMSGQMVLRGGSCATPRDHIRKTYRNFFAPPSRWQFTGIRLAKDE